MTELARPGGGRGNPWRIAGWGAAVLLLALPFAAMQFTSEVQWTSSDFISAGAIFATIGGLFELAVRTSRHWAYRAGCAAVLLGAFLLFWINGAVGIIGDEGNPLNLLYGTVILVALAGGVGAAFRPDGMVRAMIATAVAQGLVGAIAVFAGRDQPPGAIGLVIINGVFVALFVGSAWLFRTAARDQSSSSS